MHDYGFDGTFKKADIKVISNRTNSTRVKQGVESDVSDSIGWTWSLERVLLCLTRVVSLVRTIHMI